MIIHNNRPRGCQSRGPRPLAPAPVGRKFLAQKPAALPLSSAAPGVGLGPALCPPQFPRQISHLWLWPWASPRGPWHLLFSAQAAESGRPLGRRRAQEHPGLRGEKSLSRARSDGCRPRTAGPEVPLPMPSPLPQHRPTESLPHPWPNPFHGPQPRPHRLPETPRCLLWAFRPQHPGCPAQPRRWVTARAGHGECPLSWDAR